MVASSSRLNVMIADCSYSWNGLLHYESRLGWVLRRWTLHSWLSFYILGEEYNSPFLLHLQLQQSLQHSLPWSRSSNSTPTRHSEPQLLSHGHPGWMVIRTEYIYQRHLVATRGCLPLRANSAPKRLQRDDAGPKLLCTNWLSSNQQQQLQN